MSMNIIVGLSQLPAYRWCWIRGTMDSSGFGSYAQMQVRAEGCGSGAEDEAGY